MATGRLWLQVQGACGKLGDGEVDDENELLVRKRFTLDHELRTC